MKIQSPRIVIIAIVAALSFAGAAHAADVGRVLLAAGDTVALRGNETVKLTFGSAIQDKDALRTGPGSNLQVRFVDESIVSMKESSELRIDDFQFSGKEDGTERAFFRLVKGGLRTVTGLIGRVNNKNYQMGTTTATIGIRGTDYSATLCQGDCRNSDGSLARDGLYGRTHGISHGTNRIDVSNTADSKTFGVNENFYVASAKSLVERLLVSPDFVSGKLDSRKQSGAKSNTGGTGTEQATTGGAAGESRPSTTPEPLPQLTFVATQDLNPQGTTAVLPPANGFAVVFPLPGMFAGGVLFDDDNLPATFNSLNQLTSFGTLGTYPSGSLSGGSITDTGSVTLANGQVFSWGRWTGNTLVTTSGGSTVTGAPVLFGTATGLDNVTGTFGGVATYTYAGGPSPVDAGGNVGSIISSTATIDFTQQTTQFALKMNFPSVVAASVNTGSASFDLSGPGSKSFSFNGDFLGTLSGSCTGGGCLSGSPIGIYLGGHAGPVGYEFSVFQGLVSGTKAGDVAFLNAFLSSGFTPGALPTGQLSAEIAWADPSFAPSSTFSVSTGPNATFDSSNNLTSFTNPSPCSTGTCTLSGTVGTGSIVNTGSASLIAGGTMYWGRWAGGQITDRIAGTPTTYTPPGGVPFVAGTGNTVLPTSGSFTYAFIGGPPVTNTAGAVGSSLSGGAFLISFGGTNSISVVTPLTMSVGGVNYSLTSACGSSCSFTGPITVGMSLSGTCTNGACSTSAPASATATGFLVGPAAGGLAMAGNITSPAPTATFAGAFKR